MSHGDDMGHDEVTGRTQLAIDASHEAFRAQSIAQQARRAARNLKWWYGTGLLALALVGCGYALRHRVEDFATKKEVDQLRVDQDAANVDRKLMWQRLQSVCDTSNRIEQKIDTLTNTLIRERRRGQ